jgi:hypothetical protein
MCLASPFSSITILKEHVIHSGTKPTNFRESGSIRFLQASQSFSLTVPGSNTQYGCHSVEVILPYRVYQELLELKTSLEIYGQSDVQENLQRAKQDIEAGRMKSVQNVDEAIAWLNRRREKTVSL